MKVLTQSFNDTSNEYLKKLYLKILQECFDLRVAESAALKFDRDDFEKYSIFSRNEVCFYLTILYFWKFKNLFFCVSKATAITEYYKKLFGGLDEQERRFHAQIQQETLWREDLFQQFENQAHRLHHFVHRTHRKHNDLAW